LGLCTTHRRRQRLGIPLDLPIDAPRRKAPGERNRCGAPDCPRPTNGRVDGVSYCNAHLARARRGLPLGVPIGGFPPRGGSPRIGYTVDPETGCWLWAGKLNPSQEGYAYGEYRLPDGTRRYTTRHRIAYMEAYGWDSIPPGWEVDHVWDRGCRYRHCINPAHLEAVSGEEHARRNAASKARKKASKS
jgi:HNH endonuclease